MQVESKVEQRGGQIEIALLGGFQVRVGPSELHLPTRKGQALVAYLALARGKPHDREKLCALLWPESPKAQAQASLRQLLLTVRKVLAPYSQSALCTTGTAVALDARHVHVDVAALEGYIAEDSLEALERVFTLCAGPLLDGFISGESPFDEWLEFERMRVQSVIVRALEKLVEMQTTAGQLERATLTAVHSLRLDPRHEQMHRALMRLYSTQGRRDDALRQFESCRTTIVRELGIEPEEETLKLHREILRRGVSVGEAAARVPAVAQPRLPVVGREAELAQLDDALDEGWAGAGRFVLLQGDAGVGKTRLLEEAAARATERGGWVALGRCFESEQVLPFALWADLMRAEGARLREAIGRELPRAARAELARILPLALGASLEVGETPVPASKDERVLFEAVGCLLDWMAERAPLLILLEDLHWADAMSLRLLSFVVRRPSPSSRVCWMATMRAERVAEATFLQTIIHEIQREVHCTEMDVSPLSREGTRALIRSLSSSAPGENEHAVFEQVWSVSEGNPLVVLEALRDRERAAISLDVAKLPVPLRVRKLIAEHVARLESPCRETLATAAVIGRRFDFSLLQRARGSADGEVSSVIEELVRMRFLRAYGDGFYFTHDRIREVVYESLLSPRRRVLHGAVGRALEELYSTRIDEVCGAIGYHFARAGEAAASIGYLMRFAEHASKVHGVEEAFLALGEAQRQTPELPVPRGDAIGVAIAVRRAQCLIFLGRIAEIEPVLAPHRETLERLDVPALSVTFHKLAAFAHTILGDAGKAGEHEMRLLAVARHSDIAQNAGIALSQLGHDAMISGRYQSGIEHALEAVAKLDGGDDPQNAGFAWVNLAGNYSGAGEYWKALDAASRAIAIGERGGVARVQSLGLVMVALLRACLLGEMEVGTAACRRAIELAPDPYTQLWSHYAYVRIRSFDVLIPHASLASPLDAAFEASVAVLEETARTPRESPLGAWAGVAGAALAEAHLARGDAERARASALSALEVLGTGSDPQAILLALRVVGFAELSLGNFDAAARGFVEMRRFTEPTTPFEAAVAIMGSGTVAAAQRDLMAAGSLFREAQGVFDALRLPFWSGIVARTAAEHAITI